MAQKENIDILLLYIHKLDETVTKMKGTEIYPASFFDQTMEMTSRIMEELHLIETNQIEALQKQLEAHKALLESVTRKEHIVSNPVIKNKEEDVPSHEQPVPEPVQPRTIPVPPLEPVHEEEKKEEPVEPEEIAPQPEEVKVQPKQEPAAQVPTEQRQGLFLNDLIEKKNLSDFKKAFSLNDRFRFRRELFHNDEKEMERVVNELNDIQSYEASINYLNSELKWDMENQAVKDFILLLEKRFL